MDKLKGDLEVLKSWGIESVSVDKLMSMIEETKDNINVSPEKRDMKIPSAVVTTAPATDPCTQTQTPSEVANALPVGGTLFYIDDTSDGVYEFLDVQGNVIENVQVGDRPYYYRVVERGSRDRYYVYHDKVYDCLKWTRSKGDDYVYESLNTSKALGLGKVNTEIVMARDNGAYITEKSNGYPTIWYRLQQVRNAKAGGCSDWFVPSISEIEKLRKAVLSRSVTGGKIAGRSYQTSVFDRTWLHSSSEAFDETVWTWSLYSQYWFSGSKSDEASVFFIRAF